MQRRGLLLLLAGGALPASFHGRASGASAPVPVDATPWDSLRGGGHVLLMRHALTDPGIGDPPGFVLGQCATQRNLSAPGRRHAEALGEAIRTHGTPVGPVWSSRWCRCLDTARLTFGRVEAAPMLDSMFRDDDAAVQAKLTQVRARLAGWRGRENAALVTHDVNIRALTGEAVAPGEILVLRVAGGKLLVTGRIGSPV
jgi:broad specificity phosphatase PhoE